jgi:hypothetical protein
MSVPIITAYITKFALESGIIFAARAEELGTTGKIRVISGEFANFEFMPHEWEALEFLAYQKTQKRLAQRIERVEKDLERLRKLDFSVPPPQEETAAPTEQELFPDGKPF